MDITLSVPRDQRSTRVSGEGLGGYNGALCERRVSRPETEESRADTRGRSTCIKLTPTRSSRVRECSKAERARSDAKNSLADRSRVVGYVRRHYLHRPWRSIYHVLGLMRNIDPPLIAALSAQSGYPRRGTTAAHRVDFISRWIEYRDSCSY